MQEKKSPSPSEEAEILERAKTDLTPEARKSVLKQMAAFAVSMGKGAAALVDRIRGVRDPNEALAEFDAQLAANRERRDPLSAQYEKLYAEIAAKKKSYLTAAPARKKILELELRGMLSEYKGIERQLAIYLENERVITTVRARALELTAMGLRKISENDIDKLTDDIEDAVVDREDVADALNDLEKAGKRREKNDPDAFADALAEFDETVPAAADAAGAGAAEDPFADFKVEPSEQAGERNTVKEG